MTARMSAATVCSAMNDSETPARHQQSDEMSQGLQVLSYLIAGVVVYGFLGWLGDHYLGTTFLLPIGIVLGAAGGIYLIIRRFGQLPDRAQESQK
jgi:F0F1-type ATP synthase assembly protein I